MTLWEAQHGKVLRAMTLRVKEICLPQKYQHTWPRELGSNPYTGPDSGRGEGVRGSFQDSCPPFSTFVVSSNNHFGKLIICLRASDSEALFSLTYGYFPGLTPRLHTEDTLQYTWKHGENQHNLSVNEEKQQNLRNMQNPK